MPNPNRMRRRLGGSTPFDPNVPLEVGSPKLWLKADAITTVADGTAISSWPDSSGNANNATQATGANQPLYKVNQTGGRPGVLFDGVNDTLVTGSNIGISGDTNLTAFLVLSTPSPGSNRHFFFWGANTAGNAFAIAEGLAATNVCGLQYGGGANAQYGQNTLTANTWVAVTALKTPGTVTATSRFFRNKAELAVTNSLATAVNITDGTVTLGANIGLVAFTNVTIAEIIIYGAALTAAQLAAVQAYLVRKYALAG